MDCTCIRVPGDVIARAAKHVEGQWEATAAKVSQDLNELKLVRMTRTWSLVWRWFGYKKPTMEDALDYYIPRGEHMEFTLDRTIAKVNVGRASDLHKLGVMAGSREVAVCADDALFLQSGLKAVGFYTGE